MHDPFFFDRLMRAFTYADSTPLSRAAQQMGTPGGTQQPGSDAPTCRALREAEAVAAAALQGDQPTPAGTQQADRHA